MLSLAKYLKTIWFWWLGLFILGVLALCACGSSSPVVARVGEVAITAQEVAYRQEVVAVRSGKTFPAHLALFQLIEEALKAEVGRAYDVTVSEDMLAEEAARVEDESRDPETLARIRAVFGKDEIVYRRLVLAPTLVNQLLHARFSLGHDIQAEPLARAQEVLAAALLDPGELPALAEQFGGEYRQLEIVDGLLQHPDEEVAKLPTELSQYGVELPDYDQVLVEQVVTGLAFGELHPQVVEDRHSFMVVRLLARQGDDASLEAVVIPKLAFDPWFQAHSQHISLEINDQALKEALLAEVEVPYITNRLTVE